MPGGIVPESPIAGGEGAHPMLVINGNRPTMPYSEQRAVTWLQSWTGTYQIPGIAVSGCYIPDRRGRNIEADLVVITPEAAATIEVKGAVAEATSGILTCKANGRWRLSGYSGDPVHVREGDVNPLGQASASAYNLKNLAEARGRRVFVSALVLVVPPAQSTMTLDKGVTPTGCDVLLGSGPKELRAWFHRAAWRREKAWHAEDVHEVLQQLDLGDQISLAELHAEGFPLRPTEARPFRPAENRPYGLTEDRPLHPAARRPVRPAEGSPFRPAAGFEPISGPADEPSAPAAPALELPAFAGAGGRPTATQAAFDQRFLSSRGYGVAPAADGRRSHLRSNLAALAVLAALIGSVGVWAAATQTDKADDHRSPADTSLVHAPVAAESAPVSEAPPMPAPSRVPAQGCYPFQANC
ncbi:NERD domain-containing protein [Nocardia sp. NPDC051832]|uniref:NERD domain-containing protein n=1 Tax=Nocardia sp. NPDC051832 TaxID=3155673 RepID=UPI0034305F74